MYPGYSGNSYRYLYGRYGRLSPFNRGNLFVFLICITSACKVSIILIHCSYLDKRYTRYFVRCFPIMLRLPGYFLLVFRFFDLQWIDLIFIFVSTFFLNYSRESKNLRTIKKNLTEWSTYKYRTVPHDVKIRVYDTYIQFPECILHTTKYFA